ncbi:MAG: hypothetical protein LW711_16370 [Saprospiraceae bacterium]|nr:hypothetical protein [Saprospiraceae bacterium]
MPCRGEWNSPFTDTDALPYCRNNATAPSGHPSQQVSILIIIVQTGNAHSSF